MKVVDVTTEKNGKHWVRKAIRSVVEGQLPPQPDLCPENMIGLVAVYADHPERGAYFARIKKVSSGAWKCVAESVGNEIYYHNYCGLSFSSWPPREGRPLFFNFGLRERVIRSRFSPLTRKTL